MNLRFIKGATRKVFSVFTKHRKTISWFSEKRIKHQPYGVENSFSYNNYPIYYISPGEFLHAGDEIFEKEIYKIKFETSNPRIIDCGANIGLSVLYFKHIAPHAKIISFEPDTVNYNLLEKNTKHLNDIENIEAAIWTHNNTLEFEDEAAQGSKISTDKTSSNKKIKVVKAFKLKELLEKNKVDLLKIDIEGAEYDVIVDCKDVLFKAENIFLEYHGTFAQQKQLIELLDIVDKAGFNYYINSANNTFENPFLLDKRDNFNDQQLNIFCTKKQKSET